MFARENHQKRASEPPRGFFQSQATNLNPVRLVRLESLLKARPSQKRPLGQTLRQALKARAYFLLSTCYLAEGSG